MKVSTRTRYGIRAVIELAQGFQGSPLQLRVIAERQQISVKYLEQLMAVLRSAGLVRSVRGAKGGYLLARAPAQIKIGEVFRCLEGPVATTECAENGDSCDRSSDCAARHLWVQVEGAIDGILDSVSLKDLVDKAARQDRRDYQI